MFSFWKTTPKVIDPKNAGNFLILDKDNVRNVASFLSPENRMFFKMTCRYINEVCNDIPVYVVIEGDKLFFKPRDSIFTKFKKLAQAMSSVIANQNKVSIYEAIHLTEEKAADYLNEMFMYKSQQKKFFTFKELGVLKLYVPKEKINLSETGITIDPGHTVSANDIVGIDIYYPEPWSMRNPQARITTEDDRIKAEDYRDYCTII